MAATISCHFLFKNPRRLIFIETIKGLKSCKIFNFFYIPLNFCHLPTTNPMNGFNQVFVFIPGFSQSLVCGHRCGRFFLPKPSDNADVCSGYSAYARPSHPLPITNSKTKGANGAFRSVNLNNRSFIYRKVGPHSRRNTAADNCRN